MRFYGKYMNTFSDMKISGVIFDMDGVILDSMPMWNCAPDLYLESLGIKGPGDLGKKFFTMTMNTACEYMKENFCQDKTAEEIQKEISQVVMEQYRKHIMAKKGIPEFIEKLSKYSIPVTIATTSVKSMAEAAFERLGFSKYIDKIFAADDYHCDKSVPDLFIHAADFMNTIPAETFLFEDALHSIETAKTAGFRTVGIYDAASEIKQEKIMELADVYVDKTEKLVNLLNA